MTEAMRPMVRRAEADDGVGAERPHRGGLQDGGGQRLLAADLDGDPGQHKGYIAWGHTGVDRSSVLVAVWDGQPARGLGGTADVVAYARQRGVPMEVIWPQGATRDA